MEVSDQLHAPAALPLGENPPVINGEAAGWAPKPVWTTWKGHYNYIFHMFSVFAMKVVARFGIISSTTFFCSVT
jgi:hypothetical protein